MSIATTGLERWFGGYVSASVDTGSTPVFIMHYARARYYGFNVTAGPIPLGVRLPYDARNMRLGGPYFRILNVAASTQSVAIVDNTLTPITGGTIPAGSNGEVYLINNFASAGVWLVRVETGGSARLVL